MTAQEPSTPDHRPEHGSDRAVSEEGRELRLALDLVVRATGDQLQIVGADRRATR
ncbi:hypothetical protein QF032_007761 [Streptomyces achromogenes]|uniref:hypothetical protein n=1 Tax=Streptomyces achromogenes TaxID=67255 RepID=UPI0027866ACF|nr:hypothetical protein [Streptomyces achromogenes]MDQ0835917.1 hypothetical protein [Streptomyces achromogenes]